MRDLLILPIFIHFCICFSVDHPSFFEVDEVAHIRRTREDDNRQPCDEDKLINFLAELQIINPESIVKFATLSQVEPTCKKMRSNLDQVTAYLKTCKPSSQPDLYVQLIKGLESLYQKLCTQSSFRIEFDKIFKCVHELRNDFDDCGGPADWNESSDEAQICKDYKSIADCYYIKTAKVCSKEAAGAMKELLETIINSIITIDCPNVKSNPVVKDAMPDAYLKSPSSQVQLRPFTVQILAVLPVYFLI